MYKYTNGNTTVTLLEDGTKIREFGENPFPDFPESIDFKITNFCDLHNYCKWCHEASNPSGKHGNILEYEWLLKQLPNGTEIAVGGGNTLSHPKLKDFLVLCKENHIIPNLTVNELHLKRYKSLLEDLLQQKLIYGLGVTFSGKHWGLLEYFSKLTDNLVFHLIAGVNPISSLEDILSKEVSKKILLLGYKDFRKGISYRNPKVDDNIYLWYIWIHKYFRKLLISFDNLAISQLDIQRFMPEEAWNKFYMGDDGTFTMYIDATTNQFAKSSTSSNRLAVFPDIKQVFDLVKNS